ncbi:hypothetical protein [Leptospira vanthielii]|uniref:Uncharacterized protein n=1 Tax=Leptospira vanthielii TaxID=293085 RepID=A0ABY2NRV2_9LEPT|nr:hypothetical protein [Leptospira vanthielii]TGM60070.1 hypothetical protein EHQ95_04305 [Leptospira vanthielii]
MAANKTLATPNAQSIDNTQTNCEFQKHYVDNNYPIKLQSASSTYNTANITIHQDRLNRITHTKNAFYNQIGSEWIWYTFGTGLIIGGAAYTASNAATGGGIAIAGAVVTGAKYFNIMIPKDTAKENFLICDTLLLKRGKQLTKINEIQSRWDKIKHNSFNDCGSYCIDIKNKFGNCFTDNDYRLTGEAIIIFKQDISSLEEIKKDLSNPPSGIGSSPNPSSSDPTNTSPYSITNVCNDV